MKTAGRGRHSVYIVFMTTSPGPAFRKPSRGVGEAVWISFFVRGCVGFTGLKRLKSFLSNNLKSTGNEVVFWKF